MKYFDYDAYIKQLEELTGKKFDEKKFEKACETRRVSTKWQRQWPANTKS